MPDFPHQFIPQFWEGHLEIDLHAELFQDYQSCRSLCVVHCNVRIVGQIERFPFMNTDQNYSTIYTILHRH